MEYLWVGVGGAIGAISRFFVGKKIAEQWGTSFPYSTLTINLTGAFLIGIILTVLTERVVADSFWRMLIVVGFLGGYTTFSSYTFEGMQLIESGRWFAALVYVGVSNLACFLCCAVGMAMARGWSA